MDRFKSVLQNAKEGLSSNSQSETSRTPQDARAGSTAPSQPSSAATPKSKRVSQSSIGSDKPLPNLPRKPVNSKAPSRPVANNPPNVPPRRSANVPVQSNDDDFLRAKVLPTISLRRRAQKSSHSEKPTDPYETISTNQFEPPDPNASWWQKAQHSLQSLTTRRQATAPATAVVPVSDYDYRMVDVLDTIDPEVQTLTSLTNVQNSLFVPDLGKYVNRRPTYSLTSLLKGESPSTQKEKSQMPPIVEPSVRRPPPARRMDTISSIGSHLSDSRYAVRPEDANLEEWSKEDLTELNDHVRHMLHSRRSKFKRAMKGFGQYVSRPLGFLVTLYATLITLFGLAWVLFLIGWINVGGKQLYVINVIDYVLVALFAIVGDGLAPFRAVDTYRMIYIARYHKLTRKIREERFMPALRDHNDLPTEMPPPLRKKPQKKSKLLLKKVSARVNKHNPFRKNKNEKDVEEPVGEYSVLNHKQQQRLVHHQEKFAKSHTFYKPHETETHYAFPWRILVAVVILLDCHSLFQISLGAVTWGIDYHRRPFALTTVILICSISCNATAGILIMIGDRRTRKKDVLERMNRQELTQEAIEKMQKKWEKEEQEQREAMEKQAR